MPRRFDSGFVPTVALLIAIGRCAGAPGERTAPRADAPYQAEVEEGLGATIAVVIDTSGSMANLAPGDTRPKYDVALEALDAMLRATDDFVALRPDFPIKISISRFSSDAWPVLPVERYDRARVREALSSMPRPGGGTAIGSAMLAARPELYRAGTFRKYILVLTDGENTSGVDPARVAREIHRKSEGAVRIYFVAFDTDPEKFGFLKDVGGEVLTASNGGELRRALDEIYQGKILAEQVNVEPPR